MQDWEGLASETDAAFITPTISRRLPTEPACRTRCFTCPMAQHVAQYARLYRHNTAHKVEPCVVSHQLTVAFFGFLAPYLLRLVARFVTPPWPGKSVYLKHQIADGHPCSCLQIPLRPETEMVLHTRTVLASPAAHQHNAVLLDVVALAGDVGVVGGRTGATRAPSCARRSWASWGA